MKYERKSTSTLQSEFPNIKDLSCEGNLDNSGSENNSYIPKWPIMITFQPITLFGAVITNNFFDTCSAIAREVFICTPENEMRVALLFRMANKYKITYCRHDTPEILEICKY